MSWFFNEVVRAGNSQARVKNFYPESGLLVLYDIKGHIDAGMTVVGDDSGTTLTLSNFTINDDYDLNYEPDYWEFILEDVIYDGAGDLVALEEHFNGKESQDYQTKYLVVQGTWP